LSFNNFNLRKKGGVEMSKILTDVKLPADRNIYGDCGPLCVQMLLLTDFPDQALDYPLPRLRRFLKKKKYEGTLPGNMCRLFIRLGYEVNYYSTINWQSCTVDPKVNFDFWDDKVKQLIRRFYLTTSGTKAFLDLQKIRQSAQWLVDNSEILINDFLSLEDLQRFLKQNKRIILLVESNHYIVVTGIDKDYVYFNNPSENPSAEKISHNNFFIWWSSGFDIAEAIIVKKLITI